MAGPSGQVTSTRCLQWANGCPLWPPEDWHSLVDDPFIHPVYGLFDTTSARACNMSRRQLERLSISLNIFRHLMHRIRGYDISLKSLIALCIVWIVITGWVVVTDNNMLIQSRDLVHHLLILLLLPHEGITGQLSV